MNANQRLVIRNRAPLSSINGWIHIVPKGELPNAEAGIVQVLDDQSLDSILANITKDKNRLGGNWPGIYGGREHFIYEPDKDSAALAWFKEFEKRQDGIWAKDDGLTPDGETAVKNRSYKYTSFVADPSDLKKIEGKKYRVLKIETVGFTNFASAGSATKEGNGLLTPITNRALAAAPADLCCPTCDCRLKPGAQANTLTCPACKTNFAFAGASAANQPNNTKKTMNKIATTLGLAAEASEDSILAAVTKILNRGDITPDALTTLKAENKTLAEQNQTLMDEQAESLLETCGVKDEKIRNRFRSSFKTLKDKTERLGHLADFGYLPGKAGAAAATQQTKIYNRGNGPEAASEATGDEKPIPDAKLASKIMNRAGELRKQTPSLSMATATRMAQLEIEAAA